MKPQATEKASRPFYAAAVYNKMLLDALDYRMELMYVEQTLSADPLQRAMYSKQIESRTSPRALLCIFPFVCFISLVHNKLYSHLSNTRSYLIMR